MKIFIPRETGFCNGVSSAVSKALSVTGKAYCLGQIVHNASVTDTLAKKGIVTVKDINEVPQGATLIIRAHGVGKQVYDIAREKI